MSSGSAAYALADNEREIVHMPTGQRWTIAGRQRDLYRALSYARGRVLSWRALVDIVWRGHATEHNVYVNIRAMRQRIAPEVIETVKRFGFTVKV